MTGLLLTSLAAAAENVLLVTTQVVLPAVNGGEECGREGCDARAVLNRQCRRVLATSQAHRSGPQNARAPISLRGSVRSFGFRCKGAKEGGVGGTCLR